MLRLFLSTAGMFSLLLLGWALVASALTGKHWEKVVVLILVVVWSLWG